LKARPLLGIGYGSVSAFILDAAIIRTSREALRNNVKEFRRDPEFLPSPDQILPSTPPQSGCDLKNDS
jgi:hypothetical protein